MKRKLFILLFTLMSFTLTACGNSGKDSGNTSAAGGFSYSDEAYGTAQICDYHNLAVEKNIYEVTEDNIAESMEMMLYDYIEYNEVSRPSQTNDALLVTMTAVQDGETLFEYSEEDEYSIYLGYEEYGAEFDEKLTGVSAGDELSFTITYDEDYEIADLAGATIDYTVKVLSITEEIVPELTEEFITDTLGYESQAALEESIRQDLEAENESNSVYELREALIQKVIYTSTFKSYSQELYDSYAASMEESYQSYAEMFGCETVEEIYELFGMTEEDVEKEILNYVYRTIAVQAIAEKEKLELSDKTYQEGLERYTTEYEYESSDALIADYGEDSLRSWIQEDVVLDFLQEHATITEVVAPVEDLEDSAEDTAEDTDVAEDFETLDDSEVLEEIEVTE